MGVEITLPDLGEGIESGDILSVLVAEGDTIQKDQNIVEIETDKATVEVPATRAGKVTKIHVANGDTVKIGQALISVDAESAEAPASLSAPPASEPSANQATPEPATAATKPDPTVEEESPEPNATDEADATSPTPVAPSQGKSLPADAPQAKSPPADAPQVHSSRDSSVVPRPKAVAVAASPVTRSGPIAAGPAIRRFAREVGVDLSQIQGSGENGRITRDDVLQVVRSTSQAAAKVVTSDVNREVAPVEMSNTAAEDAAMADPRSRLSGTVSKDAWGPVTIEKASKIRRTIATKMHESWSTVPRVTNFDDADVTELEAIRKTSQSDYRAKGIKLTSMPFVLKAVSMALRNHPTINASYDPEAGEIHYKHYVNVGIAVDTDRGLVVPALRNTDQLSISQISREIAEKAEQARNHKFSMDDLRGGTFTVSNLGAIGGTYSTPIINVPEVAILLLGRSRKLPVVDPDDQIAVRLMMPLSLSYDHRLVDGATAARFLNDVIDYLEAPGRLLLAP